MMAKKQKTPTITSVQDEVASIKQRLDRLEYKPPGMIDTFFESTIGGTILVGTVFTIFGMGLYQFGQVVFGFLR